MGRDEWLDRLSDWWKRTVSEPAWHTLLKEQASARGVGQQYSLCYLSHSHLRRRTAKRLAAAALVCALIPHGLGVTLAAAAFAWVFTRGRFSYERLRTPPSRMLDLWQAAAFVVVPSAVSVRDEWWLTLDNGRTEHLVLHQGSAFFRQAPGADPLTKALARGIARTRTADARAALARGEPVSFGPITLSPQNLEVDGITIPRHGTDRSGGIAWGRRRWRGDWETTTPASRKGRMHSVVVIAMPEGGHKVVPTREISSLFVLDNLQPLGRWYL